MPTNGRSTSPTNLCSTAATARRFQNPARIAAIERQKENNTAVTVGEVETMRLSVYDDGAAMIATHVLPDNSRPPYRAARVWVKRNGQWQMVISVQTEVKTP